MRCAGWGEKMIHRGKTFFNNPSIHNEKSDLENYIANRPQNTIWILIKYIVLLIFFLHQFMYINKKFDNVQKVRHKCFPIHPSRWVKTSSKSPLHRWEGMKGRGKWFKYFEIHNFSTPTLSLPHPKGEGDILWVSDYLNRFFNSCFTFWTLSSY